MSKSLTGRIVRWRVASAAKRSVRLQCVSVVVNLIDGRSNKSSFVSYKHSNNARITQPTRRCTAVNTTLQQRHRYVQGAPIKSNFLGKRCSGHENDGPSKLQDTKLAQNRQTFEAVNKLTRFSIAPLLPQSISCYLFCNIIQLNLLICCCYLCS